jgi:hypothetical protein
LILTPKIVQAGFFSAQELAFEGPATFPNPVKPGNLVLGLFRTGFDSSPSGDGIYLRDDAGHTLTTLVSDYGSPGGFLTAWEIAASAINSIYITNPAYPLDEHIGAGGTANYTVLYCVEIENAAAVDDTASSTGSSAAPSATIDAFTVTGGITMSATAWEIFLAVFGKSGVRPLYVGFTSKGAGSSGAFTLPVGATDLVEGDGHSLSSAFSISDVGTLFFPSDTLKPDYSIPRTLMDRKVRTPLQNGNVNVRSQGADLMVLDLQGTCSYDDYDSLLAFYESNAAGAFNFSDRAFSPAVNRVVKFAAKPTFQEAAHDTVIWKCALQEVPI